MSAHGQVPLYVMGDSNAECQELIWSIRTHFGGLPDAEIARLLDEMRTLSDMYVELQELRELAGEAGRK